MLNPKRIMYLTPTDLLSNGFDSFVCKTSWKTWNDLILKMEKLLILVNTELIYEKPTYEMQTLPYVMLQKPGFAKGSEEWSDPSFQFSLLLSPLSSMSLPVTKTERNIEFLPEAYSLSALTGKVRQVFHYPSQPLAWNLVSDRLGHRKTAIQNFQYRREGIELDNYLLLFAFIYFKFEVAKARQHKFNLWNAFPLHAIDRQ